MYNCPMGKPFPKTLLTYVVVRSLRANRFPDARPAGS
jgi:hypothetical protein